jgi:hypothetical protein
MTVFSKFVFFSFVKNLFFQFNCSLFILFPRHHKEKKDLCVIDQPSCLCSGIVP